MPYYYNYTHDYSGSRMPNVQLQRSHPSDNELQLFFISGSKFHSFMKSTSAHGLPRAAYSTNRCHRSMWVSLFVICLIIFVFQATQMVAKFRRYEKIVTLQLFHKPLEFPAVTFCNLNPYKNSAALKVETTRNTLLAFKRAMESVKVDEKKRKRRQATVKSRKSLLQPMYSPCKCTSPTDCTATDVRKPSENETLCLCFYNTAEDEMVLWPCYTEENWHRRTCSKCNQMTGTCDYVGVDDDSAAKTENYKPCLCVDTIKLCVKLDTKGAGINSTDLGSLLDKAWEVPTTPPPTQSAEEAAFDEAQGYGGLTDPVAILAKGKENMVYAAGKLNREEKLFMAYSSDEILTRCSFNGDQCDPIKYFI